MYRRNSSLSCSTDSCSARLAFSCVTKACVFENGSAGQERSKSVSCQARRFSGKKFHGTGVLFVRQGCNKHHQQAHGLQVSIAVGTCAGEGSSAKPLVYDQRYSSSPSIFMMNGSRIEPQSRMYVETNGSVRARFIRCWFIITSCGQSLLRMYICETSRCLQMWTTTGGSLPSRFGRHKTMQTAARTLGEGRRARVLHEHPSTTAFA